MNGTASDRLAVLLAAASAPGTFSAARTAPVGDLHLEVRGVGPIELPVSRAQARQLCLVGRPARYGRGEQTLVDRSVRDTWEIPKSRVKIDRRRWDLTLVPVLERLGRELGVRSGCSLRAELQSMLVYAPGQFFVEHQDSEKDDAMVASLVVGLPSAFTGGALEVRNGGETAIYRGSKQSLSFVAFYSDCRHQVKPVTSGYRVALTYNLLLREDSTGPAAAPDPGLVERAAGCLEEHFESSGRDRLMYLLDHEYTRRSLDWSRLKGADAERVALLTAAVQRAECDAVLALADVHETWTAYEPETRHWRYRRWNDDDDDSVDGAGDYDLEDLIESVVTVDSWVDARGGRLENIHLTVADGEICASTPSDALEPYSQEYEGYMGNWGNTLDRWYHRGAVLVWPRSQGFATLAEASPSLALDELAARARNGDLAGAQDAAGVLAPFWGLVAAQVDAKGFFAKAMRTARLLNDPDLAAMLLAPFQLEMLTSTHAKLLSALVASYGERWASELVATWSSNRRYHQKAPTPQAWIASLPRLCLAFQSAGDAGTTAARLALRESSKWIAQEIDQGLRLSSPTRRAQTLSELGGPVAATLQSASLIDATSVRENTVQILSGDEKLVGCAIVALKATPAKHWPATGLGIVATCCSGTLQNRLARPPRASDDWSIELPDGCSCELCAELHTFLQHPSRTRFEWPLAKDRRAHVHSRIDTAELPVDHQTRRSGRPYTLVLTKTKALFDRETRQRRRDQQDLAWLERNRADLPS